MVPDNLANPCLTIFPLIKWSAYFDTIKGHCADGSFNNPSILFPTITWSFAWMGIYGIYGMSYLSPCRLIKKNYTVKVVAFTKIPELHCTCWILCRLTLLCLNIKHQSKTTSNVLSQMSFSDWLHYSLSILWKIMSSISVGSF